MRLFPVIEVGRGEEGAVMVMMQGIEQKISYNEFYSALNDVFPYRLGELVMIAESQAITVRLRQPDDLERVTVEEVAGSEEFLIQTSRNSLIDFLSLYTLISLEYPGATPSTLILQHNDGALRVGKA